MSAAQVRGRGVMYSTNLIEYEAKRWTMKRWFNRLKLDPPRLFDPGELDWQNERVREAFADQWWLLPVGVMSEDTGPNAGYATGFHPGFLGLSFNVLHFAEDGSQSHGVTTCINPYNIMAIYELPNAFHLWRDEDDD